MTDYKNYDRPEREFINIPSGESKEVTLLTTEIKPGSDDFSPTIEVQTDDGKKQALSLPIVLKSILEDGIKDGTFKTGTQLRITNNGKPRKKQYYDFEVQWK